MDIKQGFKRITQNPIGIAIITVLFTICLHYMLIKLYISLCISQGIVGIIKHALYLGNPMCQMINYIQFHISTYYISYIVIISTSIITSMRGLFMQEQ